MSFIIGFIFKFLAYIGFGFIMEIIASAVQKVTDGEITEEDKKLKGSVALWMIPVYGLLLTIVFELVYFGLINNLFFLIRYLIWAVAFTGFEILFGFLYDKFLHIRPWDYTGEKGSILKGYTKLTLIPLWGIAGLIIEQYAKLLNYLSPYIVTYIKSLFS